MFGFFRSLGRRRLVAKPFPAHWDVVLRRNVNHDLRLSEAERATLRDITRIIMAEKTWVGCRGLNVTDEMKLTISALAALVQLGFAKPDFYSRVHSILVYPDTFRTPNPEDGYEDDELSDHIIDGQAWYRGPVILNWQRTLEEARHPNWGHNVVVHEFVHQLDFLDGLTNGTPPLQDREAERKWAVAMTAAYRTHRQALATGSSTFFTEHAGKDEGEFFADAAEAFFCRPHDLEKVTPDVFAVLQNYFGSDPRLWFRPDEHPLH